MRRSFKLTNSRVVGGEEGNTLVIFIILLATMATLALSALQIVTLSFQTSDAHKQGKKAFYSAEVGLELAVNAIIDEFEGLSVYTESADYAGADADGYLTVSDYRGYTVKYKITNPVDRFLYQTIAGNSVIYHYAHTYKTESISTSLKNKATETLNETIRILETPLVQYFAFYGGSGNAADLEIRNLPIMTTWGRLHSNGNIYLTTYTGKTLNFRNYDEDNSLSPHSITAGGNIYRLDKATNTHMGGNVWIKITNTGTTFNTSDATEVQELTGNITSANESTEEARFNNYVLINERTYDVPGKTQFLRGGFYEQRAGDTERPTVHGIKIIGTGGLGSGNIEVYASMPSADTDVTDLVLNGESSTGNVIAGLPTPIISETTTNNFKDCRESGRYIDFTDIDLNALGQWYDAYLTDLGETWPEDGMLIYVSRSPNASFTNSSGDLQAIRLKKLNVTSSSKVWNETTLATDNPIYIHGDFNTINTRGVALIGDAINIVSNNFTTKTVNCSSSGLDSMSTPDETTVNAAFFAGNVPTPSGGGTWSGGLNNYPRFHQPWDKTIPAIAVNINGSFINLWQSSQADGSWGYTSGGIYSAPTRNWGWDVRFQDPDFWPPFIPSIYSVERVGFLE